MKRSTVLIAGLLAGGVIAGFAQAQTASQDIIITRKAGFDLQNGAFGAIRAAVAAKADLKPYADAAGGIVAWGKQIPLAFPKGSDTGNGTHAKPNIWTDNAGFVKDANDLVTAAEKLQTLIKANDLSGVADQVKAVGAACGACHRTYRERIP